MLVSIGNYALCDGTRAGGVGVSRLRLHIDRQIQVQDLFRAPTVTTFDRGNRRVTVTFDVSRTFPSQDAADIFILTHEDTLPASGIVTFTAFKTNGQTMIRWLAGGKVQSHELVQQIGVTTCHQYVIVGGAIVLTKPAS